MTSGPGTRWTTVNFAEAIQGVQTPLGWTFWSLAMETAVRRAFADLGALPAGSAPPPADPDHRISGIFYGRAAGNVSTFRSLGDNMPGSSGNMVEEKLFGVVPTESARKPRWAYRRYPVVAARLPIAAVRAVRALPALRARQREWWQSATLDAPPRTSAEARSLMRMSAQRFILVGVPHTVVSMLGSALLDELGALAARAGRDPAAAMVLASGYGGMEESQLLADVLACARGRLGVAEVVRRHGYHGFDEGNLTSRSWREDRAGLESFVAGYGRPDLVGPAEREAQQAGRRQRAERELLAALPTWRRGPARATLALAGRIIPMRELGKASFLHALDGARCAARAGGALLAEEGVLADPEDVFFLTYDEFVAGVGRGAARDLVAERRERHRRYEALTLPPAWTGQPVPLLARPEAPLRTGAREIAGIGVVGDLVSGRARVVTDPAKADLQPGDVLVCATTDPSWTPLFLLAEALVIDTGGAMSHGAIVARELGVPCVINTVSGTRDIPEGASITVDPGRGVVTVHNGGPAPGEDRVR